MSHAEDGPVRRRLGRCGAGGASVWALALAMALAMIAAADRADAAADSLGAPAPAPGTLVRISTWRDPPGIVWQRSPMFRATLLQATAESLRLAPLGDDRILDLARADVRLEVHAGRSHLGGAWTGAAFGLFVGLGVGTLAALVYGSRSDSELSEYAYIIYPVAFAAYGIPIGAVIGGISGVDRWRRVE